MAARQWHPHEVRRKAKPSSNAAARRTGASATVPKASKRRSGKSRRPRRRTCSRSRRCPRPAGAPSLPRPKRKKPQLSLPLPLPPDLNQLLASPDASDDNHLVCRLSSDSGFRSDLPTGDFKGAARRPPTPPKRRSASANGVSEEKSNAVLSDAELVRQMLKEERQHQQRAIAAADLPSSPRRACASAVPAVDIRLSSRARRRHPPSQRSRGRGHPSPCERWLFLSDDRVCVCT